MIRQRVRIRFRKEGDLRWISHRDLIRVFERLFRRADLKLGMSEGFHPKARMSFPLALGLGIEGREEVMEFELAERMQQEPLQIALTAQVPPGLVIDRVEMQPENQRKAQVDSVTYQIEVPPERRDSVQSAIEQLLATPQVLIDREGRRQPIDLKEGLQEIKLTEGVLHFRLGTSRTAGARPREYLVALELGDQETQGACLIRSKVTLREPVPPAVSHSTTKTSPEDLPLPQPEGFQ